MAHGEANEVGFLLPDERVGLTAALGYFACAPGVQKHGLARLDQFEAVARGRLDRAIPSKQVPEGRRVVQRVC